MWLFSLILAKWIVLLSSPTNATCKLRIQLFVCLFVCMFVCLFVGSNLLFVCLLFVGMLFFFLAPNGVGFSPVFFDERRSVKALFEDDEDNRSSYFERRTNLSKFISCLLPLVFSSLLSSLCLFIQLVSVDKFVDGLPLFFLFCLQRNLCLSHLSLCLVRHKETSQNNITERLFFTLRYLSLTSPNVTWYACLFFTSFLT